MEGGGLQSDSEVFSITVTFAAGRHLRVEDRVGVRLDEPGFLLVEALRPADP